MEVKSLWHKLGINPAANETALKKKQCLQLPEESHISMLTGRVLAYFLFAAT